MERRRTERLLLAIPIRVLAFGSSAGGFSEDTHTVEVNCAGARIALKHRVSPDDSLRIINLENFQEADFRVVGPTRLDRGEAAEWGVECLDSLAQGRNIWGIDFPRPLPSEGAQAGALLVCRGCGRKKLCVLTLMEVDVLDSTDVLQRLCDQCGQLSSWTYADANPEPQLSPGAEPITPAPTVEKWNERIERRAHKRVALKLPVLVRNLQGESEISKTENVSKGGLAVCLAMRLALGEIVKVVCPYTEGGQHLEQKAEVRRRVTFYAGTSWVYGFRYVS